MPIPKPTASETEKEFVKRCMSDDKMVSEYTDIDHNYLYHTYEEAELACLTKLIEIVEQKQT